VKSPAYLAARWRKQWQTADAREQRLLDVNAWPISLPIGKPTAAAFTTQSREVREHVQQWRAVRVGQVQSATVSYRAGGEPVEIPTAWILRNAAEWAAATGDSAIELEHRILGNVLAQADRQFHRTLIRQLRLVANAGEDVVLQTLRLVQALEPGSADGRPLRALAIAGIDSKFFERNRALIQHLLDARFEDQASEQGLESFLGALDEGDHWLLIAPLQPGLLAFTRQSVPAAELMSTGLAGTHLLVVENERSLHQLPQLSSTVAVLGSGLNLAWMRAPWLASKTIGYWGDIDTWGLTMLAAARELQPSLDALLMDLRTFEAHAALAVPEPHPARDRAPIALTERERDLYMRLRTTEKGRLEQEFLPRELVVAMLYKWRSKITE
jgi:hypothetical protein